MTTILLIRHGMTDDVDRVLSGRAAGVRLNSDGRRQAAEVAQRLGCSVPIARTTLNRLVQSGHATRPAAGRFRARGR